MSDFAEGYAVGQGNNGYNNGGFGYGMGEWAWIVVLFALCGGWGNGFGGGGNNQLGYELGRVATTNDVASGFNNSAVLGSLNDIKLGQSNMQNFINQGFYGINDSIKDCCCQTQRAIDGVNYNMARNTCDIIQSGKDNTQRILDYLNCKENQDLRDRLMAANARLDRIDQSNYLVDQLRPVARPAYLTCSPFDSAWGRSGGNCGNNCCGY